MNRQEPIADNEFHHVYNRGNRKQPIFRDDSDYRSFLGKLQEGSQKYGVQVGAYCLMPNHYHLLLVERPGGSVPTLMTALATSAARRFNLKYHEIGHLFHGPYQNKRIDSSESLANVARYIHLNPVAAGLVKKPEDWPFSDFAEGYLQQGSISEDGNFLLESCGMTREEYVALVRTYQQDVIDAVRAYLFGDTDEGYLQPGENPR